VEDPKPREVV
jgi:hypothetical protein